MPASAARLRTRRSRASLASRANAAHFAKKSSHARCMAVRRPSSPPASSSSTIRRRARNWRRNSVRSPSILFRALSLSHLPKASGPPCLASSCSSSFSTLTR